MCLPFPISFLRKVSKLGSVQGVCILLFPPFGRRLPYVHPVSSFILVICHLTGASEINSGQGTGQGYFDAALTFDACNVGLRQLDFASAIEQHSAAGLDLLPFAGICEGSQYILWHHKKGI
jgi:hypothetical protein